MSQKFMESGFKGLFFFLFFLKFGVIIKEEEGKKKELQLCYLLGKKLENTDNYKNP